MSLLEVSEELDEAIILFQCGKVSKEQLEYKRQELYSALKEVK